jgi:hypothetical protein
MYATVCTENRGSGGDASLAVALGEHEPDRCAVPSVAKAFSKPITRRLRASTSVSYPARVVRVVRSERG